MEEDFEEITELPKGDDEEESGPLKKTIGWIITVVIAVFVAFALWATADRLSNYNVPLFDCHMSVISSESMSRVHEDNVEFLAGHDDRYYKNDLIFVKEVPSFDDIHVYDVILFLDEDLGAICHRVVRIDREDGQIWTRGDANNVMDGVVTFDEVVGIVTGKIPEIGVVTLYLASPYGLLGVSIAIVIIFGGALIIELMKKDEEEENKSKALASLEPPFDKPDWPDI